MEKIDTRKVSQEVLVHLRRQVVRLRRRGHTHQQIAEIVGISYTLSCRWCKRYERGGDKALIGNPRGRQEGQCRHLTPVQERNIQRWITDKCPDQLKLDFALWTRGAVSELILQETGLRMPIRTVGEYLKRWGFTPQKPLRRAYQQNPKAVRRWLEEQYPAIAAQAKEQKAEIHWADETGLKVGSQHGRSFAPRGQTPAIELSAKHDRINLISSLTNQGKVRFMIYREKMTSQVLIRFLERLIKDAGRKVFLIMDNLRVHHSHLVQNWLNDHSKQILVHYLPSYSPELNPDEYLNCDLKAGVHSRPPSRNRDTLAKKTLSHLRMLQKRPQRIQKYFKHPKIAYAA